MAHRLITFLGRSPATDGGYRLARYRFPDGTETETSFFGRALAAYIEADAVTVLGTHQSTWDVLFPADATHAAVGELRMQVREGAVHQQALELAAPELTDTNGQPWWLRVIPYGDCVESQLQILRTLLQLCEPGDTVSVDITHALRHLPLLALLSVFYLRTAKEVRTAGIYYGALEMSRDGAAPVISLDAVLEIIDWVRAIDAFDRDGDYGVFADLLRRDGLPPDAAGHLRRAAFLEQVHDLPAATEALAAFQQASTTPADGLSGLFQESLQARLSWTTDQAYWQRHYRLAQEYRRRGRFLRAILYGLEAFKTRLLEERGRDVYDRDERERVRGLVKHQPPQVRSAFNMLNRIRNAVAHGPRRNEPNDVRRVLADPQAMSSEVERLFNNLFVSRPTPARSPAGRARGPKRPIR